MRVQAIQPEKRKEIMQFYISEKGKVYYKGQTLTNYDETFIINKFIIHNHRKSKGQYLCVNLNSSIYKTKNWTLNVDLLESYY